MNSSQQKEVSLRNSAPYKTIMFHQQDLLSQYVIEDMQPLSTVESPAF